MTETAVSPESTSDDSGPTAGRWLAAAAALTLSVAAAPRTASAGDNLPDLSGQWAQKVVQTSVTDLPVLGTTTSTMTAWVLLQVRQQGRRVTWQATTCEARIEGDVDAIRTVLPDAFVDAVPTPERTGRLVTDEGTTRLEIDRNVSVMGADLSDPAAAPLPDSPSARTVADDDGDGHPGVTIRMEGMLDGDLYIVQRARDSYTAPVDGDDHIRGLVDWNAEREILKATHPLLGSDLPTEPHPDARKSWFEMTRLDDDTTCQQLISERQKVFGD